MARILLITQDVKKCFEIALHHTVSWSPTIEGAKELIGCNKFVEKGPKEFKYILLDEEFFNKVNPEVESAMREFAKTGANVEFINKQSLMSLLAL